MLTTARRRRLRPTFLYRTDAQEAKETGPQPPKQKQKRIRAFLSRQKRTRAHPSKQKEIWLAALSLLVLLPLLLIILQAITGYGLYRQVQEGVNHLQAAVAVFHNTSSRTASTGIAFYLDAGKLRQAQEEIDAAHADFAALSNTLEQDGSISLASAFWPTQINTARALGRLAVDGTAVAQRLLTTMRAIAPSLILALQSATSSPEQASPQPFLTPSVYQQIMTTLADVTPLVHDMALAAPGVSLTALPISGKQQQLIASLLPLLPTLDAVLAQRSAVEGPLRWLLGIDSQRAFLIEPMDRTELRATGGFTGQFGELVLNGAHPGPVKLANIGKYEEDHTYLGSPPDPIVYPKVEGQSAPAPYSDWWPIPNFGMRDANVSADFPTSARIVMNSYRYEFGRNVDGVVMFTSTLIEYVLHITGPIAIPAYDKVVTEYNLESLLHYYQLDNGGIYQEQITEHVSDPEVARKLFTQRVTSALITAVSHLPLNQMLALATEVFHALKTKDLEVYVTNPRMEALIGKYGSTASLDRSNTHDGLFVVQSNLSGSKASQYVQTTIQDTVTLDPLGGATHTLHLTLNYLLTGNPYGFETYRDYVRIYVPESSLFLSGNGFDQFDQPYCGDAQSGYRRCRSDVFGDQSLICTAPPEIGYTTDYIHDPFYRTDHPLDKIGPPQNQTSDEAGRAMFGGWVIVPKNCNMEVTLSWYVPPMNHQPYSLLVQAQSGVDATLDLTIQPPAALCSLPQGEPLQISQALDGEDTAFTLQHQGTSCSLATSY